MKKMLLVLLALSLSAVIACQSEKAVVIDTKNQPPQTKNPDQLGEEIKTAREMERLDREAARYMQAKEYHKALECYNKILATYVNDGITQYNVACVYSLLKDKAKALEYLKKAVQNGFREKEFISTDKDLDFIRNEKEYREIIDGIR